MKNNTYNIQLPEMALIVLVGTSSSGKSTFANQHFKPSQVVSSDACRAMVSDDENNLNATQDAFELAHFIIRKRLQRGQITVFDATNLRPEDRALLLNIAKELHVFSCAIVLDVPEKECQERHLLREDRSFGRSVIRNQYRTLKRSYRNLKREGFRFVHYLDSKEKIETVNFEFHPLYNNKKEISGPFDIIGDVHGCYEELVELLIQLGYRIKTANETEFIIAAPEGRKAVFVGDLTDRGPASHKVLRLVMAMVSQEVAFCVCGNHDFKLLKYLKGKKVQLTHGLDQTVEQLSEESEVFLTEVKKFLNGLISHYVFDEGRLVVTHAGIRAEMQGRGSGTIRSFCMYGETTGEVDEFGLPVRYNWAKDYKGKALVVYGHTPVHEVEWLNNTVDIDTGCVFGGKLTAMQYPERTFVSVTAKQQYAKPAKPLSVDSEDRGDTDVIDIADVTAKKVLSTPLKQGIILREENALAAMEVMSRYAVDPKWLMYLPPTMSPSETSALDDYLEHPQEALAYYKKNGVERVICQQKHMGSRAVVLIGKNEKVIAERFSIDDQKIGKIYTRTGRDFFDDETLEKEILERINKALDKNGFWKELETDWVLLDAELMPWSAKAQGLIKEQYAGVGSAAEIALNELNSVFKSFENKEVDVSELKYRFESDLSSVQRFKNAYKAYCWKINSIDDFKLAPFHILATEGSSHFDKDHKWHMKTIASFCRNEPILLATEHKIIELNNVEEVNEAIDWWVKLTESGGEGMVVKPINFVSTFKNKTIQPAIKCRGREYLRIIYGPNYTEPKQLSRLKKRGLSTKRSMALREFALSVEAVERCVRRAPLARIHECVFGVLALESEPVDPRL